MSQDREVKIRVGVAVENTAAKRAMEELAREASRVNLATRKAREEMERLARGQVGYGRPGVGAGAVGAGRAYIPGATGAVSPDRPGPRDPLAARGSDRPRVGFTERLIQDHKASAEKFGAATKSLSESAGRLSEAAVILRAVAQALGGGGGAGGGGAADEARADAAQSAMEEAHGQPGATSGRGGRFGAVGRLLNKDLNKYLPSWMLASGRKRSGLAGRLAAGAAAVGAARDVLDASGSLRDALYDPHTGAAGVWDAAASHVPFLGGTLGKFARESMEMAGGLDLRVESGGYWLDPRRLKLDRDRYGENVRAIANEPANRTILERNTEGDFARRDRAAEVALAAARAAISRRVVSPDPGADALFGGLGVGAREEEEPQVRAAREAQWAVEREYEYARAAAGQSRAGLDRIRGESGDAIQRARGLVGVAEDRIGRANSDPAMEKEKTRALLTADSSVADMLQKQARYKQEYTQLQERSLALTEAERAKDQAVAAVMQSQLDVLRTKEERLRGGLVGYAAMGPGERKRLADAAQRAERDGLERVAPEDRSLLLGNGITGDYFQKKALGEVQGDKTLQTIFQTIGQKDFKAVVAERIKLESELRVKVEVGETQSEQQRQAWMAEFKKELDARDLRIIQVQNSNTRVQQVARSGATGG